MSKVARFYSIPIMQSCWRVLIISAFLGLPFRVGAEEFSEQERLLGFKEHQRHNAEMDRERQAEAGEVKKKRERWEQELQQSVDEYKAWKARQKAALDETSPEYKEDLALKKRQALQLEEEREEFVRERNRARANRKLTVHLTEEHEYGLDIKPERIEIEKRKLYNPNGRPLSRGSSNGSADFGAPPPPPPDYNPPVSAAPAPEFFEPEVPPPPPPPPGEFDENIPPPIFDDPDF